MIKCGHWAIFQEAGWVHNIKYDFGFYVVGDSVAGPTCLSRIPDLTTKKEEGGKSFCPTFFCSHKYHKIENYFIFKRVKKFFLAYSIH
jgi:hypothetical protein